MSSFVNEPYDPSLYTIHEILGDVHRVLKLKLVYEARMNANSVGKASSDLRTKAQGVIGRLSAEEVHGMFLDAVRLHPPGDQSEAAAAALYDLARSYDRRRTGPFIENLLQAERYYRASLACPSRDTDPLRGALTRDGLASCLRQLADNGKQYHRRDALRDEVERLSREAVELAFGQGPIALGDAASYLNTFGNLLGGQGRADECIAMFDLALICAERWRAVHEAIKRALASPIRQSFSPKDIAAVAGFLSVWENKEQALGNVLVQLNAATWRMKRNQARDAHVAERLLIDARRRAQGEHQQLALIQLAELFLQRDQRERAVEQLRQLDESRLRVDCRPRLVDVYSRAGLREKALDLCHSEIERIHNDRVSTLADHSADDNSNQAQMFAAVAARLHVKGKEHVRAFLVLENTAGSRFQEEITGFVCPPHRHRIAQRLCAFLDAYRLAAIELDEQASRLAYVRNHEPDGVGAILNSLLEDARGMEIPVERQLFPDEAVDRQLQTLLVDAFVNACAVPDPVEHLRLAAGQALDLVLRIGDKVRQIEPEAHFPSLFPDLTSKTLRDLLCEHPDHWLLRFSLTTDLLAISVHLKNGRLSAVGKRHSLPRDWLRLLDGIREDPMAGDHARINEVLRAIDLSEILPTRGAQRAVLLPSKVASYLPLAALGPAGRTILDRFESVVWLPTLAPLRRRQHAMPLRRGTLTIAPGSALPTPTKFHEEALAIQVPEERRLRDQSATPDAVRALMWAADVVVFYTHGRHKGERGPEVELAGGRFDLEYMPRVAGAERVELWACQSGVNISSDWLTPAGVDEDAGLDVACLRHGARSAVGSLWAVPEGITAKLVHRYRRELKGGADAATALCRAQRAWRDEIAPSLLKKMRDDSPEAGLRDYWSSLGGSEDTPLTTLASSLGLPAAETTVGNADVAAWSTRLLCPTSWAGFRFSGVPDFRPGSAWSAADHAPPTKEEDEEAHQILMELKARAANVDGDNADDEEDDEEVLDAAHEPEQEHLLQEQIGLLQEASWNAGRLISLARLYHDRLLASHRHNVLLGIAWLHEALTVDIGTEADRQLLRIEVAHLWLELAAGELWATRLWGLTRPHPVALARAEASLEGISPPPEESANLAAARARCRFLRALSNGEIRGEPQHRQLVEQLLVDCRPVLDAPLPYTYANARALALVGGLLLLAPDYARDALKRIAERIREVVPRTCPSAEWVNVRRLTAVQFAVQHASGRPVHFSRRVAADLTPAERIRATWALDDMLSTTEGAGVNEMAINVLSDALGALEQACWGSPFDQMVVLWKTTGTPGRAYRSMLSCFLDDPARRGARHVLVCLQQACDLRLSACHRLVRVLLARETPLSATARQIWTQVHLRELLIQALADTALPPCLGQSRTSEALATAALISKVDPFFLGPAEVQSAASAPLDGEQRLLAHYTSDRAVPTADRCKTTVGRAAIIYTAITSEIDGRWGELRKSMREQFTEVPKEFHERMHLLQALDPGIRFEDCAEWLDSLPPQRGVLGLGLGFGSSIAVSFWHGRDGIQQREARIPPSRPMQSLLARLLISSADLSSRRGQADQRTQALLDVEEYLAPLLDSVLGPLLAEERPVHLGVFAPGALRMLPICGLRAGGRRILDYVASLTHLPSLRFGDAAPWPAPAPRRMACLFGADDDGLLAFGRAAVTTLRRMVAPLRLEHTSAIGEVLAVSAPHIDGLRIYGIGSPIALSPTVAGLRLDGNRWLGAHVLRAPLPICDTVELWACTSASGIADTGVLADDEDRLPGLVPHFLRCGAHHVIDLAWPVVDLVKALVCERFGLLRMGLASSSPVAIAEALRWTGQILTSLTSVRAELLTVRGALLWLDEARHAGAIALGADPSAVEPFAPIAEYPPIAAWTLSAFLEEITNPSHLAAFRIWGGLAPPD